MKDREPVSEAALFYAYRNDPAVLALKRRPGTERRPCACKGIIEADPECSMEAVAEHNGSPLHQEWRKVREGLPSEQP